MNQSKLHKILPNLIFSAAAIVPGATAALIMLHAGSSPTTDLAGASTGSIASSAPVATPVATATVRQMNTSNTKTSSGQKQHGFTARAATVRAKTVKKSTVSSAAKQAVTAAPTATPVPTAITTTSGQSNGLQSAPLQAQSANTNAVSGATSR